ncbi:MAG TPA: hypothetical protein PK609_00960 [Candidatus Paceibacterota bacterium]|nr:hypothetical protein [Candidatus Paceibacterota bacterium]
MNAERRGSVAYTDKERLQILQEFLPESQVRDFVHQMQTSFPRYFAGYAKSYAAYRREIQDSAVFSFDKDAVQEAYKNFNKASEDLYRHALAVVIRLDDGRLDTSELYFPDSFKEIPVSETLEESASHLGQLASAYQTTYEALLREAVSARKVTLAGSVVRFDDKAANIIIGNTFVHLAPTKNQHDLARVAFSHGIGEIIQWSEVYEVYDPRGSDTREEGPGRRTPQQESQTVKDAIYALNKRIKKELNTDEDLITWQKKTLRRNF